MAPQSIWQTWKPYAVIAVVVLAGIWWFNNQSSLASLRDGDYACQGVYVNESGKYEVVNDSSGGSVRGTATARDGKVVGLEGSTPLDSSTLASLIIHTKGDDHFLATDDPAVKMYYAMACDFMGN